ncbi:MAG TPA: ATP-grasp domain-containing protein [Pirellulales bacterium]|nr:ATP-grasp domain-containing protein [Pirellulales bacterium]
MKMFVYEYLTGGGLLADAGMSAGIDSLAREGRAMCAALAADFAAVGGIEVMCLHDARQAGLHAPNVCWADVRSAAEHDVAFDRAAADADRTVVIAPEIGGVLLERCRRVIAGGGRLLGSSPRLVELAGDKHATAVQLAEAGVPVPRGMPFVPGEPWPRDFPYPAVWKPLDGAGSQGLRFIEHSEVPCVDASRRRGRLEAFCPGMAASVALLCGSNEQVALPPCRQRLSRDGRFHYLGGALPLPPPLSDRATRLARRAIQSLPGPLGYLGVDLVLGESDDGSRDVVIEINPRLTTSYIGLRAACRQNLAAAMLAIASDGPYNLSFSDEMIEFP